MDKLKKATRRSLVPYFVTDDDVDITRNRFGWRCVRDRGTLRQPQSHHPRSGELIPKPLGWWLCGCRAESPTRVFRGARPNNKNEK